MMKKGQWRCLWRRSANGFAVALLCLLVFSSAFAQVDTAGGRNIERDPSGRSTDMESMARLRDAVKRDSILISQYLDSLRSTPQERMRRALTFSPSEWKPTEADRARRAEEIWRSQGFDKIFGNIPRVQLMSVPLGAIAAALGLTEDVSPRIKYTILATDSVSVIVYNTEADTIRVIVNGLQRPGVYDFNWDMNGGDGHRVPLGHYVAEVVVGRRLVLRKRIEVP